MTTQQIIDEAKDIFGDDVEVITETAHVNLFDTDELNEFDPCAGLDCKGCSMTNCCHHK